MACGGTCKCLVVLTLIGVCNVVIVITHPILDGPYISVNGAMDSITKQKGSSITFLCDFQYQQNSDFSIQADGRIIWKKDGVAVAEWSNREERESYDKYVLSLNAPNYGSFSADFQITSLIAEEQGHYSCHVENGDDVNSSNDLRLVVEYPPSGEYPKCSVLPVDDDKRLVCLSERGSPLVSLQWMKDGDSLQQTVDDDGESFVEVHTTVAGGPDASIMGRYECSMTYKRTTRSCFLDRPNMHIQSSTSGLAVGEDLEVICLASTSDNPPVSTFRWEVNPNRHHTVDNDGSVLRISNITSRDNGTVIICEGQNAMGRNRASSVIILRPVEATPTPITVELEQTETPTVVGRLARFECRTTPEYTTEWNYNGAHIDPSNTTDRFFVEGKLNNVIAVRSIAREDVMSLVACFVTVGNRPKAEMYLTVNFSLTAISPRIPPTETAKLKPYPTPIHTDTTTYSSYTVSQTPNRKPHTVTPKVDTSRSKGDSSFFNSQIMWYIIGGMMCIVLLGICCWVSLKAKSLMCDPQRDTKSVASPTLPPTSCRRINGEDFVVRVGMPGEVRPSPTADQSMLTKEQLVEQEVQYQDLDDVSRQRQINEYQRLINNVWMPPPLPN